MRLSTPSSRKKPGAAPVWQHNRPLALHKICNEARQRYRTTRYHDATETNCTPKMTFFIPSVLNQTAAARLRCKIMIRPGGTRHPQGCIPLGQAARNDGRTRPVKIKSDRVHSSFDAARFEFLTERAAPCWRKNPNKRVRL
jgi:hypothetical protein